MSEKKARRTYFEIKEEALAIYYDFCRDHGVEGRLPQEKVLASVDYHFDGTFNWQLEELMFLVVELILSGGWYPEIERYCRQSIEAWCAKSDLWKMLDGIPKEESDLFVNDLRVLKLL